MTFRNKNFIMVTWLTNLRKLYEEMIFFINLEKIITGTGNKRILYITLNAMRQSACLVFNPIMVGNYAAFLNAQRGSTGVFHFCSRLSLMMFGAQGCPSSGNFLYL